MTKPSPTNRETNIQPDDFLVSKTDIKGRITYANPSFIKVTGFSEKELLGKPHSLIRHKDMPKTIFKLLWEEISNKREIFAYVKNVSKDGGFYWVYANVTASLDSRGNIIGYYSVRRKANPKALDIIVPLYEKLLSLEKSGGINASEKYLTEILEDKGVSYDEFSNNLQRL
ncbi:MAG TPA: PAS domain S-box protein [Sulfurospirillum arcachonense]|nr:PAS domain S-box protein [Sulfurospirillum arcachonense]